MILKLILSHITKYCFGFFLSFNVGLSNGFYYVVSSIVKSSDTIVD